MAIKKVSQLDALPLSSWFLSGPDYYNLLKSNKARNELSDLNNEAIDRSLIELSQFTNELNERHYWLSYQTTLGDFKQMLGLSAFEDRLNDLSVFKWDDSMSALIIICNFGIGDPTASWTCGSPNNNHTVYDDPLHHLSVFSRAQFYNRNETIFHGPVNMHNLLKVGPAGINCEGDISCNVLHGVALSACWADIAEIYESDEDYSPGTLVKFGGEKEITVASHHANAVVTSKPGVLLNDNSVGLGITLTGRVPVKVIGPVKKFDKIVLSATPGVGIAVNKLDGVPSHLISNTVVGKALESSDDVGIKLVECVVQMNLE